MTIRGLGNDTVEVQRFRPVRVKGRTTLEPVGSRVRLERVDIQSVREWSSSEEYREHGLRLYTLARMFCRVFPGDTYSRVYWNGVEWEVVGSVQEFNRSRRTRHVLVTLRQLGEE